jgi:hypothetical protein
MRAYGVINNAADKPALLTMFTGAMGFLELLAPSPVKKDDA